MGGAAEYAVTMSPRPNRAPATNGHSATRLLPVRQIFKDRQGKPFTLTSHYDATRWHFELQTPQGRHVGHLQLDVADRIGRIASLGISASPPWIPSWLQAPLARLALPWPLGGFRRRGLASQLLIHVLKTAGDLHLRGLLANVPTPNRNALRLFKNLGFSSHQCEAGTSVWYRISD